MNHPEGDPAPRRAGSTATLADRVRRWRTEREVTDAVRRDLHVPAPGRFASFGTGSRLEPPARVVNASRIHLGDDTLIGSWSWLAALEHDGEPGWVEIGSQVRIGRYAKVAALGRVVIGAGARLADAVYVLDSEHGHDDPTRPIVAQPMTAPDPVHIGPRSVVGALARILPGTTLGADTVVGPGAVVQGTYPDGAVLVGNPAVVVDPGATPWI